MQRLKLKKFQVTDVDYQWAGAFRLRVECSDPSNSGTDPNVFVYKEELPNPYSGQKTAKFMTVASPVDMADLPVGEPVNAAQVPFFRLDYIELDFRSVAQANDAWVIIIGDVNNLLEAMAKLENLKMTEEVWVGAPFTDTNGNSESNSSSS